MAHRLTGIVFLLAIASVVIASSLPKEENIEHRDKRDVMESMKNAWQEVVKTLSDAGDAVVHVFKPTEKSIINKMADEVKQLTQ